MGKWTHVLNFASERTGTPVVMAGRTDRSERSVFVQTPDGQWVGRVPIKDGEIDPDGDMSDLDGYTAEEIAVMYGL